MQRDNNVIEESEQIKGLLDSSCVDCDDTEEAIELLFCGHSVVDERKISVGDDIVICIMCKDDDDVDGCNNDDDDGCDGRLEIRIFTLKKH